MEFFAIARVRAEPDALQGITLEELPGMCPTIERLLETNDPDRGRVWTVWG